jgi:hypothetical protein
VRPPREWGGAALILLGAVSASLFCFLAIHPEMGLGLPPPSSIWLIELLFIVTAAEFLAYCTLESPPIIVTQELPAAQVDFRLPGALIGAIAGGLAAARNVVSRVDWEIVIKDATPFAFVGLGALFFSIVSKHPEVVTNFATVAPLVIGGGLLGFVMVSLPHPTYLHRRTAL